MKITDIAENKKNKNRVSIYIDGQFAAAIFKENALEHRLKIGLEMDETDLIELVYHDEKEKGLKKAYQFLSFRARSAGELEQKLLDKGFANQIVTDIIYELKERKLLDDREYAKEYAELLLERGYGQRAIVHKLYEKQIDRETVALTLESICDQDSARKYGEKIAAKYQRENDPRARKQKFIQALARHGFGFDQAKQIYGELFDEDDV